MSIPKDTFSPASADDVCENCSRTRAEHKSSICVTGGFCKFPVRQNKATDSDLQRFIDLAERLKRIRDRGSADLTQMEHYTIAAADEIERLRRIIDKLIDAWPNDDIPVEVLDGRA